MAQESPDAAKVAREVLEKPEFVVHSRNQQIWVPDEGIDWPGFDEFLIAALAAAVLAGLYFAVRGLIRNHRFLSFRKPGIRVRAQPPAGAARAVMGMSIERGSLPEDIPAAALELWQNGNPRAALSLLYRGALSRLTEQFRLPIRDSDTEEDCLQHVIRADPGAVVDYFRNLTRAWTGLAYGGHAVSERQFAAACREWPFDRLGARSGAANQRLPIHGAAARLALPFVLFLSGCGHWESVPSETGFKGKARTDPFLAAQMVLERFGHSTSRKASFEELPEPENGLILVSSESGISAVRAEVLMDWVREGGHLVYAMAGCTPYNDWLDLHPAGAWNPGDDERQDPVLEKIGVTLKSQPLPGDIGPAFRKRKKRERADQAGKADKPAEAPLPADKTPADPKPKTNIDPAGADEWINRHLVLAKMPWFGRIYTIQLPSSVHFKVDRQLRQDEFAAGDRNAAPIISLRHGGGRVTVMTHARPLRNRYFGDHDHAPWLAAMAGDEPGEAQFIAGLERSFMALLWERGWMVIAGLATVIGIWLWAQMPRFGPRRFVELHETRHFVDHISALGQFFHRLRRDDVLLRAAVQDVRARAQQRHPQLCQGGEDLLIGLLAERTALPAERIQSALQVEGTPSWQQIIRHLQDLQTLRNAL